MMIGMGSLCLLATAAPAQVTVGPGGVTIGGGHDREWRRRNWDRDTTGTIIEHRGSRCRTITVRKENEDGDMVTKRIRRCD
jgi:hypothetical protein